MTVCIYLLFNVIIHDLTLTYSVVKNGPMFNSLPSLLLARYYGNCGWSSEVGNKNKSTVKKKFLPCATEVDKFCGLLQCVYSQSGGKLKVNISSTRFVLFSVMFEDAMCATSSFDVGK